MAQLDVIGVLKRSALVALCRLPGWRAIESRVRRAQLVRGMVALHGVLATTPMSGRYWVWAGMLLGWAREGDVLTHDSRDVDFAYLAEDEDKMLASIPSLVRRGFKPLFRFQRSDGEVTQWTFRRAGANFDFFKLWTVGDRFRYVGWFGFDEPSVETSEVTFEIPAQPRVELEMFGRRWAKVLDHERELAALYGDWKTPRLDWRTDRDSPAVVCRQYGKDVHPRWDGNLAGGQDEQSLGG